MDFLPPKANVTISNEIHRNEQMFSSAELLDMKIDNKINELARANKLKISTKDTDGKVTVVNSSLKLLV